jgi:PRTRC genetic system protein B
MKLTDNLKAKGILVMYAHDQRSHYNSTLSRENVYFEYAPVINGVPGAFTPLADAAAGELGKALVAMDKFEMGGFVPGNLLYLGLGNNSPSLIWSTPPAKKKLLFNIEGFPKELTLHVPWLVWYYHRNSLYLYAAKSKPIVDTKLYWAPFSNITRGSVCLGAGTSILDRSCTTFEEVMHLVELAFYGTMFTHLSETGTIKGNLMSLQKKLHNTENPFPKAVLLYSGQTVKNLIDGQQTGEEEGNDED